MEKWIAENIGTVITIISLVIGFAASYAKLNARLDELNSKFITLANDFEDLRKVGVPFVCPIHEQRLKDLEDEMKRQTSTILKDIVEIKEGIATNHDLIMGLQRSKMNI